MDPGDSIRFWSESTVTPMNGVTLIRLGGHFSGSTIARWNGTADGKGVILSGDTIQVGMDRKSVSFMYSYPNYIPLSRQILERISKTLQGYEYDRIYGALEDRNITSNAKATVAGSISRYITHLEQNSDTD